MEQTLHPISDTIASVFNTYPKDARQSLLHIRSLIYSIADSDTKIGSIIEELKWGEASFATHKPKSGTPVRMAYRPQSNKCAIMVHCSTTVIDDFKQVPHKGIEFEKNRAILFPADASFDEGTLKSFLKSALTYHIK